MRTSTSLLSLAALLAFLGRGAGGEVVALTPAAAGGAGGAGGAGPAFAPRQRSSVRAAEGRSVTLECRVLRLGDKAVSWVRSRDLQILTHGGAVFTADARVSVPPLGALPPPAASHALRIDRLRRSDAGRYECQLNTEPKMSLFFDLVVMSAEEMEAETSTAPPPEPALVAVWAERGAVRGAAGGAAELACGARLARPPRDGPAPPLDIRWLRHQQPLTLQDGAAMSRVAGATHAEARLRLVALRRADAGDYVCAVGDSSATVHLYVDDGDNLGDMEAMQRDQSAGGGRATRALSGATLAAALLARLAAL